MAMARLMTKGVLRSFSTPPALRIREMKETDLQAADVLQRHCYPEHMVEDVVYMRHRFEAYPTCSLVVNMAKEDVLRHGAFTELPPWALPDTSGAITVGFVACYPWPESLLSTALPTLNSDVTVERLKQALKEKSRLMYFHEITVGLQKVGVGRVLMKKTIELVGQLGFSRLIGVSVNENIRRWGMYGYKPLRKLPAYGTHVGPDNDINMLVAYDYPSA